VSHDGENTEKTESPDVCCSVSQGSPFDVLDYNGATASHEEMIEWAVQYNFQRCKTRLTRATAGPYHKFDVIASIYATQSNLFEMSQLLGRSRYKVKHYVWSTPDVYDVFMSVRETFVDVAEKKLRELVDRGDGASIRFVLMTLGRSRGYSFAIKQPDPPNPPKAVVMLPSNSRDKLQ